MIRRLILFVAATALLVAAAVWLADRPGAVTIRWQGWRVDTTVPVLVLLLLALLAAGAFAVKLARAILGFPGRVLAARRERRTREGYRALSDGLAAVAAGDRRQAKRLARRADKLLPDRSLTGLLTAQAATLAGDEAEAERRLTAMVERPETAVLGLKGLLDQTLKRHDHAGALDYARRAWALGGPADGIAATLFDLQARAGQWAEAEATLAEAKKRGALSPATLARFRALTLLERARAETDPALALRPALDAHKADPGLVPAAVLAATLLHRLQKPRKAAAILTSTWRIAPHPELGGGPDRPGPGGNPAGPHQAAGQAGQGQPGRPRWPRGPGRGGAGQQAVGPGPHPSGPRPGPAPHRRPVCAPCPPGARGTPRRSRRPGLAGKDHHGAGRAGLDLRHLRQAG
ncbi:MAG: hypothetical protein NVV74_05355 [Magnetospirillum sp.]|nr:hypothetical protein [Magnetospirillum sp.]